MTTVWIERATLRYRSFTNGAWSDAAQLFESPDIVDSLSVVECGDGDLMAVWRNGSSTVRAQRFARNLGWQPAELVHATAGPEVRGLQVRCSTRGHGLALWVERTSEADETIMVARFD